MISKKPIGDWRGSITQDMNPGDKVAEGKFREVTEAYEVLSDRDNRSKYDRLDSIGIRRVG